MDFWMESWTFDDWHFSDDARFDALVRQKVRDAFHHALNDQGMDGLLSAWWSGTSWRVMLKLSGEFMPERDYSLAEMVDEAEDWAAGDPETALAIAEEMEKQAKRLRDIVNGGNVRDV